jgi:hypothetical protein
MRADAPREGAPAGERSAGIGGPDPEVAALEALFGEHPVWTRAARRLREGAESRVAFAHRPGERWRLLREGGRSRLLPEPARDPDLAFRFPPAAIRRLARVEGGVGRFAVALFELMAAEDPQLRVEFRVVAPFARLVARGYLRLLLAAGPELLAFGAARGVRTLADLRRIVEASRARVPAAWEG